MGKFYPSRGVYPVWQTPHLLYKRDQINMRDYVERQLTPHLSGLPHLPGEYYLSGFSCTLLYFCQLRGLHHFYCFTPRDDSLFYFSCRFLERDPDDAELEVDFFPGENVARVKFYDTLKHREPPLCRLHLKTPAQGTDCSVSHSRVF